MRDQRQVGGDQVAGERIVGAHDLLGPFEHRCGNPGAQLTWQLTQPDRASQRALGGQRVACVLDQHGQQRDQLVRIGHGCGQGRAGLRLDAGWTRHLARPRYRERPGEILGGGSRQRGHPRFDGGLAR